MKKIVLIMLCFAIAFAFASCKKDNASGIITDSKGVSQQSSSDTSAVSKAESGDEKSETTVSTTTPMPTTKAKDAIPISADEAYKRLSEFYGSAYHVEEKELKDDIQHYEVRDNQGNLYSKLEVNLKNSDVKETIEHSGEVNEFNLLV